MSGTLFLNSVPLSFCSRNSSVGRALCKSASQGGSLTADLCPVPGLPLRPQVVCCVVRRQGRSETRSLGGQDSQVPVVTLHPSSAGHQKVPLFSKTLLSSRQSPETRSLVFGGRACSLAKFLGWGLRPQPQVPGASQMAQGRGCIAGLKDWYHFVTNTRSHKKRENLRSLSSGSRGVGAWAGPWAGGGAPFARPK